MSITVEGQRIHTTPEGFLVDQSTWTDEVAETIACRHGIDLNQSHWEILHLLRVYCAEGNEPPSMRTLAAVIRTRLGESKSRSIYLMKLFGSSPAKMAARLAGLPRPKNCL